MKIKVRKILSPLVIVVMTVIFGLAVTTAITQHRYQQSRLKQLHLQQIALAVRDYLRDHPQADQQWPAAFVAGNQTDAIWCTSLERSVSVWDLGAVIKSYLYQFPLDPSKDTPGISGYYLQRTDSGWHVGACSERRQFELAL